MEAEGGVGAVLGDSVLNIWIVSVRTELNCKTPRWCPQKTREFLGVENSYTRCQSVVSRETAFLDHAF